MADDFSVPQSLPYQRDDSDGANSVIIAADLTLTPQLIPSGRNLIVYADALTISGNLALHGHDVIIEARTITSQNATLDASAPAPPVPPGRASDGAAPQGQQDGGEGAPGSDGGPGGRGTNAGNITIKTWNIDGHLTLLANGGAGQQGQDGGSGGVGHIGTRGADGVWRGGPQLQSQGQLGNAGGRGGPGGNGGPGGRGGDGGTVRVWTHAQIAASKLTIHANGGDGGAPGAPGAGGGGGTGGLGGELWEPGEAGSSQFSVPIWKASGHFAGIGPTGPAGFAGNTVGTRNNPAKPPVNPASRGGDGQVIPVSGILGDTFLPSARPTEHSLTQRTLVLRQAELDFLNRDYASAHTRLAWLYDVTPGPERLLPSVDHGREWTRLHDRAGALLGFLERGLDYYGEPRNHVPLASLDFYRQETPTLLQTGKLIEDGYRDYLRQASEQSDRLPGFQKARDNVLDHIEALRRDLDKSQSDQNAAQNAMALLAVAQNTQQVVMLQARDEYKYAVEHAAHGCSFGDVIKSITTIITMGLEAYENVRTIGGFVGALRDETSTAEGTLKKLVAATGAISDLQEKVQMITALNTTADPDHGKVAVRSDEFAKHVAEFDTKIDEVINNASDAGLVAAAKNYKKQVHTYVDIIQARNRKVYDYTALVIQSRRLRAMIDQKQAELDRVKTLAAASIDPMLPQIQTFMAGAYHDLRLHVIRYLVREYAAFSYATLENADVHLETYSIGTLATAHEKLMPRIEAAVNSPGRREEFVDQPFHLLERDYGPQFLEFRAGRLNSKGARVHHFGFSIPLAQNFRAFHQVVANSFTVALPNAQTDNQSLDVVLIHSGHAQFRDKDRNVVEFTHAHTLQNYTYDLVTGKRTAGGALGGGPSNPDSIGVSPCTTWLLAISEDDNPGLDLRNVKEISVTFSGHYYHNDIMGTQVSDE